jgi:hypothetical protein
MGSAMGTETKEGPGRALKLSPHYRLLMLAKSRILDHLATHGPTHVAGLPRSWPITGLLVRWAVRELIEEGSVRYVGFRAPRRVTLTAAGMRARAR